VWIKWYHQRAGGPLIISPSSAPPDQDCAAGTDDAGETGRRSRVDADKYLDDASLSALTQVRIVHGSGTGVLRQLVRDMLYSHPLVKSFRPGEKGEGGNGVTIVRLGK